MPEHFEIRRVPGPVPDESFGTQTDTGRPYHKSQTSEQGRVEPPLTAPRVDKAPTVFERIFADYPKSTKEPMEQVVHTMDFAREFLRHRQIPHNTADVIALADLMLRNWQTHNDK